MLKLISEQYISWIRRNELQCPGKLPGYFLNIINGNWSFGLLNRSYKCSTCKNWHLNRYWAIANINLPWLPKLRTFSSDYVFHRQRPKFNLLAGATLQRTNAQTKFRYKYSQKRNYVATVPISTIMCLWAIYTFPRSICLFRCKKYVDRTWECINRSQTHECVNWDWGRAIPRKEIYRCDFRCSVAH